MTVVKKFKVLCNNPVHAGEYVVGNVLLSVTETIRIRGITVHVKAEAIVRWYNGMNKTFYEGNDPYLDSKFYIIGGPSDNIVLEAGDYTYPFGFLLPPDLPTSFITDSGGVFYTLEATLDREGRLNSSSELEHFLVFSSKDLNGIPHLKEPVQKEKDKHLCCLWCKSGPVSVVVTLPYTGFVPGQQIPVTVQVDNASRNDISSVVCALRMTDYCQIFTPDKHVSPRVTKNLDKKVLGGVKAKSNNKLTESLKVPLTLLADLDNCRLINVEHQVHVTAHFSGVYMDLEVSVPVELGKIPLSGIVSDQAYIMETLNGTVYNPSTNQDPPAGVHYNDNTPLLKLS